MIKLVPLTFANRVKFNTWVQANRPSTDGSYLPWLMDVNEGIERYTATLMIETSDDRHAFTGRGLHGLNVAAGITGAALPVTTDERIISVGQSVPEVVVAESGPTTDGIDTEFTARVLRGMPVPGSMTIHAPGLADVTEGPEDTDDPVDGTLLGDDLTSGSMDYVDHTATLEFASAPDAGELTIDYTADVFPASVAVPPGVHLRRVEIEFLSGTGTPDFTWTIYEDPNGVIAVPGATGTTGAMTAGAVHAAELDKLSVVHSPLVSHRGQRWVGLQADAGDDHQVAVRLVFSGV